MTPDTTLPDIDGLKKLPNADFANAVCASLRRCDVQSPAFNLAAGAKAVAPQRSGTGFHVPEVRNLILAGIKALREYDGTGKIATATREEFILADVRDHLRDADTSTRERVMNAISSRLFSLGTLALLPPPVPKI